MVTADSVKAKLQGLIGRANGVTGKADATLTQAVEALIAGFGQGSAAVYSGSFTPAENIDSISLTVQSKCSNLLFWRVSQELVAGQRIMYDFFLLDRSAGGGETVQLTRASSGGGTSLGDMTFSRGSEYVFSDNSITLKWYGANWGFGVLSAGAEYRWMAW